MKLLIKLFSLPVLPIIMLYGLYVTYRIVKDTDDDEKLDELANDEQKFNSILDGYYSEFHKKWGVLLNCISLVFWLFFIKIAIL